MRELSEEAKEFYKNTPPEVIRAAQVACFIISILIIFGLALLAIIA